MVYILAAIEIVLAFVFIFVYQSLSDLGVMFFRWVLLLPVFYMLYKSRSEKYSRLLAFSFFLIAVADTVIIYVFEYALLVFLLVHVFNFFIFNRFSQNRKNSLLLLFLMLTGIYGIYVGVFSPFLTGMNSVMVLVYMGVIVAAAWKACSVSAFVFFGYMLFILCDLQVAYKQFVSDYPLQFATNCIVYYSGLFFIGLSAQYLSSERRKVVNVQ